MRGAAVRVVMAGCDLPAPFRELADELPQWLGQFPETDPVRGPVVHLKVDVRRVAAAPGGRTSTFQMPCQFAGCVPRRDEAMSR